MGSSSQSLREDEDAKALEMKFSVEDTCFRRFAAGCFHRSFRVLDEEDAILVKVLVTKRAERKWNPKSPNSLYSLAGTQPRRF